MHLGLAFAVGARQFGEGAVQFLAAGEDAVDDHAAVVACGQLHLPAGAAGGEVVLDVGVDDLVHRPEVGGDAADLLLHLAEEEAQILRVRGGLLDGGELVDLRRLFLAVAVDAADALFQAGRVERDVEVDEPVAVRLQVDPLAGGVGGDQDPDVLLVRRGGELRADVLPFLGRGGALDHREPVPFPVAVLVQDPDDPVEGLGVLGEHDDALVGPGLAVGPAGGVQELDQGGQPGVGLVLIPVAPLDEGLNVLVRGSDKGVGTLAVPQGGELGMGCVALFLVGLPAAQDLLVVLVLVVGLNAQPAVGFGVVLESPRERPRDWTGTFSS